MSRARRTRRTAADTPATTGVDAPAPPSDDCGVFVGTTVDADPGPTPALVLVCPLGDG